MLTALLIGVSTFVSMVPAAPLVVLIDEFDLVVDDVPQWKNNHFRRLSNVY
jgi:hypothetical protein